MLVQPVPTMNINELPLECNMFVSRVNMDLKIVYCEGRYTLTQSRTNRADFLRLGNDASNL